MGRYYFHLSDGENILRDNEGADLPDTEAAAERALDSARDILSAEIRMGRIPLNMHLAVEDDAGLTVHRLPFAQAFEIVPERPEHDEGRFQPA